MGVWGLGMQLTSALHYKEERNFPWDLSWQIARVFGYPRQESQSVLTLGFFRAVERKIDVDIADFM